MRKPLNVIELFMISTKRFACFLLVLKSANGGEKFCFCCHASTELAKFLRVGVEGVVLFAL